MPDRSYVVDGKTKYAPVVKLDKSLRQRVEAVVLQAWEDGR
jgi:hypothetical protein